MAYIGEISMAKRSYTNIPFHDELKIIKDMVKSFGEEEVLYDVGANVGIYSIIAGNNKDVKKVYSFEPQKSNYKNLNKNIEVNDLQGKVEPFKVAISNDVGEGFLEINGSVASKLSRHVRKGENKERVNKTTLNRISQKKDRLSPTVVKVDVEGEELNVLDGMRENEDPKIIYVEIHKNEDKKVKKKIGKSKYTFKALRAGGKRFLRAELK